MLPRLRVDRPLGAGRACRRARAIAMFVVSTRKGEHSASNEAVEEGRGSPYSKLACRQA